MVNPKHPLHLPQLGGEKVSGGGGWVGADGCCMRRTSACCCSCWYGCVLPALLPRAICPMPAHTSPLLPPLLLRRVVKLVRALRKGWIKQEQQAEKPQAYLIWEDDGGC